MVNSRSTSSAARWEDTIASGTPVNVTLLFDADQYVAQAEAFMRGIERRVAEGLDPNVGSVASLFVLDDASNGLVVSPVLDSAAIGDLPTGGIQTGGGATAVHVASTTSAAAPLVDGLLGVLSVLGVFAAVAGALALIARRSSVGTGRAS